MSLFDIFALTLRWWLVVQAMGLLALPLAFRALRWLPGRGYGLAKSIGLLLSGYLLWVLGSLGFLSNTAGGAVFALVLLGVLSAAVYWRSERGAGGQKPPGLPDWLREHQLLVLVNEVVFALALFGWAYYRAHNPQIAATEKPMEFAFLNSLLRDPTLPPSDPWLSGYAISYYYFGYVLVSIMVRLTGVMPGAGFNLALALLMALAASGAFAVAYDLVAATGGHGPRNERRARVPVPALLTGVLAAVMLVLMGNYEAPLEIAHQQGMLPAGFWTTLDVQDLTVDPNSWPPAQPLPADAGTGRFWWWWRASRVVHDCNPGDQGQLAPCAGTGRYNEVIDEFPFFSFLLADMHPHVLALPFTLVALGLGFNLLQRTVRTRLGSGPLAARARPVAPVARDGEDGEDGADGEGAEDAEDEDEEPDEDEGGALSAGLRALAAWTRASLVEFGAGYLLLYAVFLGALGFLNTWDLPTYILVCLGALLVGLWRVRGRLDRGALGYTAVIGISLVALSFVLYLPFWIGFRSQLGGLLPNLIFPTRMPQFLVFFAPFIVLDLVFLIYLLVRLAQRGRFEWEIGLLGGFGTLGGLFLALVVFLFMAQGTAAGQQALDRARGLVSLEGSPFQVVWAVLGPRLGELWLPVTLAIGLTLATAALAGGVVRNERERDEDEREDEPATRKASVRAGARSASGPLSPSTLFVLGLITVSMLVTIFPEFFYLRDLFGSRINTIFKFYYQAWILSSIAGAFAVYFLLTRVSLVPRAALGILAAVVIGLGLLYPAIASGSKLRDWSGAPTLDGLAARMGNSAEYEAVQWLNANVSGQPVILEAVGGSYTEYARVSASTGLPTVIGWPGHEDQWRGTDAGAVKGSRENDVQTIFSTPDWATADALLAKYNVEYVYIGPLERPKIPAGPAMEKFKRNMVLVYQSADGQVEIYRRPGPVVQGTTP